MIRTASPNDAKAVAEVHVKSWQAIYRGHFPDQYLDNLSVDRRTESWTRVISHGIGDTAVFELAGEIVGFISLERSRDEGAGWDVGKIAAVYLHPNHWRRGYGSALLKWAAQRARERGWRHLTLWVLRENAQARAFYERLGFVADGATKDSDLGDGTSFVEVRYAYPRAA
jgi:GNAT superfamily N-acetyltransferase